MTKMILQFSLWMNFCIDTELIKLLQLQRVKTKVNQVCLKLFFVYMCSLVTFQPLRLFFGLECH